MPRAYKLPNAAATIEEINAAQSQLNGPQDKPRGCPEKFRRQLCSYSNRHGIPALPVRQ